MEESSFTLPSPTGENMDTEVLVKVEEDNLQSAPSDLGADVIEVSVYSCGFDPSSYVIDLSSCFDKLKSYQSVNVKCLFIFLSQLLKVLLKRNQIASITWLNLKMALGSIKRTGNGFFNEITRHWWSRKHDLVAYAQILHTVFIRTRLLSSCWFTFKRI